MQQWKMGSEPERAGARFGKAVTCLFYLIWYCAATRWRCEKSPPSVPATAAPLDAIEQYLLIRQPFFIRPQAHITHTHTMTSEREPFVYFVAEPSVRTSRYCPILRPRARVNVVRPCISLFACIHVLTRKRACSLVGWLPPNTPEYSRDY